MIIRKSTYVDEPDMIRMGKSFWAQTPLSSVSAFNPNSLVNFIRASSMSPASSIWVADDNGKVVGTVGGIAYPLYFSGDLVVQELFWWVDPEKRGSDAGKMLYSELERWSRDIGAVALSMIAIENGSAEGVGKIYKRMGFVPTEHAYMKGF